MSITTMILTLDGGSEHGTNGENQVFRFVKGIWLHRQSRLIQLFFSEKTYFTSYVHKMFRGNILYKYHVFHSR